MVSLVGFREVNGNVKPKILAHKSILIELRQEVRR